MWVLRSYDCYYNTAQPKKKGVVAGGIGWAAAMISFCRTHSCNYQLEIALQVDQSCAKHEFTETMVTRLLDLPTIDKDKRGPGLTGFPRICTFTINYLRVVCSILLYL